MAQTVLSTKTANEIIERLNRLANELASIRKKLVGKAEPPYGSKEWWKWSNKKALEEAKRGEGTKISNKKELDTFFKSL